MPRKFLTLHEEEDRIHRDIHIKDSDKKTNFWYCYKIPILILIAVIICLGIIIAIMKSKVYEDYNIAILSENAYSYDTIDQLESDIATKGTDLNGDGQVLVKINQYTISLNYDRYMSGEDLNTTSSDTDMIEQMNNISNFNDDVENYQSMIYLVDDYSLKSQLEQINIFSYPDGSIVPKGTTDYQNIGQKWTEFPYLESLKLTHQDTGNDGNNITIDESSQFDNLYLCMRDVNSIQDDNEKMDYYNECLQLKNSFYNE